jgi:hypothetical protein
MPDFNSDSQGFYMSTVNSKSTAEYSDKETKERAIFAAKVFCRLSEEHKINTCSWEKSPAWKDYVEGKIDEAELSRSVESSVRGFVETIRQGEEFQTPLLNPSHEDQKARRVKVANRIYRNACAKSGQNKCFFKNFTAWSEFVNGIIDENTFIETALFEVLDMKKDLNTQES